MTLIRWNPTSARHSGGLQDDLDRMFSGYFTRAPRQADGAGCWAPAVDIEEFPHEYVVRADLPGISSSEVKVSVLGDILTLSGERKREDSKPGDLRHAERFHGSFERTFKLTRSISADRVTASYRDGVLEVHVPKAEEARVREIEVQVG